MIPRHHPADHSCCYSSGLLLQYVQDSASSFSCTGKRSSHISGILFALNWIQNHMTDSACISFLPGFDFLYIEQCRVGFRPPFVVGESPPYDMLFHALCIYNQGLAKTKALKIAFYNSMLLFRPRKVLTHETP